MKKLRIIIKNIRIHCKPIVFIMLFFITFQIFCQGKATDEIQKLKSEFTTNNPTQRVESMLSLCYEYFSLSADTALYYASQALKLSKALKNDTLTGRSYLMTGYSYLMLGDDSLSFLSLSKSAEIFKKNNDSANLANILFAMGQYYFSKGDYDNSLQYYFLSLGIYRNMNNPKSYENVMTTLDGIGYVYYVQKDYKQALNYFQYALKLADVMNDNGSNVSAIYRSIGNIYLDWKQYKKARDYYFRAYEINQAVGNKLNLAYSIYYIGNAFFELKSFDTSFYYYYKAAEIFTELSDKTGLSAVNQCIGNYYREKKYYHKALEYYTSALALCEKNEEMERIASFLFDIGQLYYNMNNYDKALSNSGRSIAVAEKIGCQEYIYQNYLLLSNIYSAMDSCQDAFGFYKLYVSKKDSLFDKDIHQQISDIQEKYESDKKEKTIKIQNQTVEIQKINIRKQKIFRNSMIIVAFLLLALAVVVYGNLRQKRRANIIIAAEKQKSDNLLLNILPEKTAEELKEKGFASTRYYEMVTVLFTDFAGFTKIAEKMTPEKLVEELDYCFKAYDLIVEKHHVEKIKTIGDSYMCAGGLPEPNSTNAVDVVMCGLEICRFMQEYKQDRMSRNEPFFEIRIGIHTGPVVSGIVGSKKFAYDIWGDTVNTAARMESSGKPGLVNISGDTYLFIKDKFRCTYRGKVEAKNKGLVDMYFVECCLDN